MKLTQLTEAMYYDREVTDDNFEEIKRDMVRKIEKAEGPDKHERVKRDILSARNAQHLADIMKAHIRKRGGAAAIGETVLREDINVMTKEAIADIRKAISHVHGRLMDDGYTKEEARRLVVEIVEGMLLRI